MRGGYQIIDLSTATIGFESIINDVYQTIKHFDGKPVFIITPNTSGVFAEFTENNGMYIGAYIGSNSHLYTVSIISSNRVTITDKGPAGGGGTSNYNELSNKPAIAGTTLSGDKPLSDFGIQGALIAGSNISIDANNEISANVDSIAALSVTYNNTSSGMTSNNVQDAITELNSKISQKSTESYIINAITERPGYYYAQTSINVSHPIFAVDGDQNIVCVPYKGGSDNWAIEIHHVILIEIPGPISLTIYYL